MERVVLLCGHFVGTGGAFVRAFAGGLRESVAQDLYEHIERLMQQEAGILTSLETQLPPEPRRKKRV